MPSSAIEMMNPPTFGAVMSKSDSGNVSDPATWTAPSANCACAGISTLFGHPMERQLADQGDVGGGAGQDGRRHVDRLRSP